LTLYCGRSLHCGLDPVRRPAILTRLALFSLCLFVAVDAQAQSTSHSKHRHAQPTQQQDTQPQQQSPQEQYPQQQYPQQQYPQQQYPQQQYPQQQYPQQQYPQQQYPQQQYPQQQYPQQQAQPGSYGAAPGYMAQGEPQPAAAAAQTEPLVSSVDGVIQLGLSTALVQHVGGSLSPDMGESISQSTTTWGIAKNPVSLEGAYGILPNLLIGGLLQLGGSSAASPPGLPVSAKTSSLLLSIGPKVDYMFMPDSKLNPFAGVMLGIAYSSSDIGTATQSQTDFIFMARGGLRWFVFDSLSLDPTLVVGGAIGSGTQTINSLSANLGTSSFQIALMLGVSVWLK
jgi:hypothetical protein